MTTSLFRPNLVTWIGAMLVLAGAVAFRLGLLEAPGEFDEFYHLLAAQGWLETGAPRILDGEYWRGALFTRMVVGLFAMTGAQDLPVARLVSVVAGSLLPVVLFLWINRVIGPGTAVLAATFAILWPQGILEAQFVRFYAVHVLTFVAGSVSFYLLLVGRPGLRLFYLLTTALCWTLAIHFQISSAVGIVAALLGGLLVIGSRRTYSLWGGIFIGSYLLSLLLITLVILSATGILERAWSFYRWTPEHAAALRNYYGFYFNQLQTQYGILWLASLVLVPLGLRANAALTLYCGTIFVICFLTHSFGGMKALRYLSYAVPFLFVMWALGLRAAFDLLTRRLETMPRIGVALVAAIVIGATTNFIPRSLQLAEGAGVPDRGDWSGGREIVGDWMDAPFIATTRELHQLAFIGEYDVLFNPSRVTELDPPKDFGIDPRTGRPVVGQPENVAQVFRCVPDGLLVTSPHWWYDEEWADRLEPLLSGQGALFTLRERGSVLALRWHYETPRPASCAALPLALPPVARRDGAK